MKISGTSIKQLLFIFFLLPISAIAQTYFFENYSVKEGLGQSNVYDIYQDDNGFLWLGTASGISKFDGHSFINYTNEDGIAENGVRSIYKDSKGGLWFGHNGGGISRNNDDDLSKYLVLSGGDITKIAEDATGNIWIISSSEGAIKISNPEEKDGNKANYQYYKGQEGLSDRVFGMLLLKDGKLCFITDVGIKYYQEDKDGFEFLKIEGMTNYFQTTCMFQSSTGDYWVGTQNGGVKWYQASSKSWRNFGMLEDGLAGNFISTINESPNGDIWVGTWGGGISVIRNNEVFVNYDAKNGLKDNKVRRIIVDREGNVLVGTNENGLMIYKGEQFVGYSNKDGLLNDQVWAVLEDHQGKYWMGTNDGVSIYDPLPMNGNWQYTYTTENGLPHNQVRFIKEDGNHNVWIATWGGGIIEIPGGVGQPVYDFGINYNIVQGFVSGLDIDQNNDLWIGTIDGLVYYNSVTGNAARITQSIDEKGEKTGIVGNDISCVYVDQDNQIWVGSRGKGITKVIKGEHLKFEEIKTEHKFTPSTFYQANDGKLWIGTEGYGIIVLENDQVVQNYRAKEGLLSDFVSTIDQDANGDYWIGTNIGLTRIDAKDGSYRYYSQKEGFTGVETKPNASFIDQLGRIWYGTVSGVMVNTIDEEKVNVLEPNTHITGFMVNLENRPIESGVVLSYTEKDIRFDFSSICLSNPEAVRYKFMLEGADEDWRPVTDESFARYSPLPPGEYTFKLIGINNYGIENTEPITFHFVIEPPFWQRTWFFVVCGLVLTLSFFGYTKLRERRLKQEKKILEEKVQERTAEVVQQKEEIEHQKEELSEKNKDIMDSIRYAERIQRAILPIESKMNEHLEDVFVLFNPKDIVSGDFYWFHKKEHKVYFSAIDCTGHGVPGAFVSIIGNNGLNRAVNEYKLSRPSEIMDKLNEFVEDVFKQEGGDTVKDGMDMALCCLNKENNTLEYAGANNPIYIIRDKEKEADFHYDKMIEGDSKNLYEIRADRQPIGSFDERKLFHNHELQLSSGDCVYLFSDGYADQFGGPKGKKFKYTTLKKLLMEICDQPMANQKVYLNDTLAKWMNDGGQSVEQIDDVLLVGVRV